MSRLLRNRLLLVVLLVMLGCGVANRVSAQATPTPTGEFLCSVPGNVPPDGKPCNGDEDCPGGTCVVAQGVCNAAGASDDGFPCDCAGGTCVANTCSGGTAAGLSCDPTTNCSGSEPCVGTQKVCLSGADRGFSCVRNDQCSGSNCVSTGKFCMMGTDFAFFSCVVDADCCMSTTTCPRGACVGSQPTPTATRVPTRTTVPGSPRPTNTPSPTTSVTTPVHTGTPTPTGTTSVSTGTIAPTRTSTATLTPRPGSRVVADAASAGATTLSLVDASGLPSRGDVQIGNDPTLVPYSRCSSCPKSNTLRLGVSLASDVAAGTVVQVVAFTPTPGPAVHEFRGVGEGAGCAIVDSHGGGAGWLLLTGGVLVRFRRRCRSRLSHTQ